MSDTSSPDPMRMGQASFRAVADNAASMFNHVIQLGDLVNVRQPNGAIRSGCRLVRAAWVDDSGEVVCQIEGTELPVPCRLVSRSLAAAVQRRKKPPATEPPKPPKQTRSLFGAITE